MDALQYITRENTDLVITDWVLPEMDGLEVCRQLKHSPATQEIPIVMVTGRNDEIDVVTAVELGAEEYVIKPFRIVELLTQTGGEGLLKRTDHGADQRRRLFCRSSCRGRPDRRIAEKARTI